MGKKPDQVARDIDAQRAHITAHVEGLQKRVRDDLETAQSAAKERVNDAVQGTKDTMRPANLLEEHPVSSIAGAMAIGVVLGVAGNGGSDAHSNGHSPGSSQRRNGSSSREGALSGLVGSILMPAARAAQEELQGLVREGFSAFKQQASEVAGNATGDPYRQNRDVGVE